MFDPTKIAINISCNTCRKSKVGSLDGRDGMYYCEFRGSFHYLSEELPCDKWLPSKTHVRNLIHRFLRKSKQNENNNRP